MKHAKSSGQACQYRTAIYPVTLSRHDYQRAHQACYKSGLIWNGLVKFQKGYWQRLKTDPNLKELREFMATLSAELLEIHSHTQQAIVDDLIDAVATCRENRRNGLKTRAPWREKKYRPLTFTRNFGWRIANGVLYLSLGARRPRIRLKAPEVMDPVSELAVPVALWGEIKLCWDRDARRWSLHIAVPSSISLRPAPAAVIGPEKLVAIDEGIINPMTVARKTEGGFEVTVINGRAARAIKDRRNRSVAQLRSLMSKCTKGSLQWRRYNKALKAASAQARAGLRNIDHQVSRKVARIAQDHGIDKITVGDVRGIEKRTNQSEARRCKTSRNQRRRLSQWSRGIQEDYLGYKTALELEYIQEDFSSQTCLACLTRNRPKGRQYRCSGCGFTCHRDAVGAINIWMRATHGEYRRLDAEEKISVLYLRATPLQKGREQRRVKPELVHGVPPGTGPRASKTRVADKKKRASATAVPSLGQPRVAGPVDQRQIGNRAGASRLFNQKPRP
jgi:putative transposase